MTAVKRITGLFHEISPLKRFLVGTACPLRVDPEQVSPLEKEIKTRNICTTGGSRFSAFIDNLFPFFSLVCGLKGFIKVVPQVHIASWNIILLADLYFYCSASPGDGQHRDTSADKA